jgi:phage baseplate assembly protein W
MPNLNFDNFKMSPSGKKNYTYSDLHLDLRQQQIQSQGLTSATIGKDIDLDYDLAAIMNSLNNLFNTVPGQRFLLPDFGVNLMQYLFIPVSKKYGDMIGNDILDAITRWEPRVRVDKVLINADPDNHEYEIAIAMYIPAFKTFTGLSGKLSQNGFAPIRMNL